MVLAVAGCCLYLGYTTIRRNREQHSRNPTQHQDSSGSFTNRVEQPATSFTIEPLPSEAWPTAPPASGDVPGAPQTVPSTAPPASEDVVAQQRKHRDKLIEKNLEFRLIGGLDPNQLLRWMRRSFDPKIPGDHHSTRAQVQSDVVIDMPPRASTLSKEDDTIEDPSIIPHSRRHHISKNSICNSNSSHLFWNGWLARGEDGQNTECCCICMEPFQFGETVARLKKKSNRSLGSRKCKHWFHRDCILNWLEHHNDCPLCRTTMVQP